MYPCSEDTDTSPGQTTVILQDELAPRTSEMVSEGSQVQPEPIHESEQDDEEIDDSQGYHESDTPNRGTKRKAAAESMKAQANRMRRNTKSRGEVDGPLVECCCWSTTRIEGNVIRKEFLVWLCM